MTSSYVSHHDDCGTVACHAGWYAMAKMKDLENVKFLHDSSMNNRFLLYKEDELITFDDGIHLMARDMGFEEGWELREWAEYNPEIWGNDYGYAMFSCDGEKAFGYSEFSTAGVIKGIDENEDILDLEKIVSHWRNVADRLEKIELEHVRETFSVTDVRVVENELVEG